MNNIVIKKMHDLFTGKDDEPVLIMSESGMPILETMSGVTMPADYSFECINNFVHCESPDYEDLQNLALGMSSHIDKLEAQIAAASAQPEHVVLSDAEILEIFLKTTDEASTDQHRPKTFSEFADWALIKSVRVILAAQADAPHPQNEMDDGPDLSNTHIPAGNTYGTALDQLYAAFHREPCGDTLAAIGTAIQELQEIQPDARVDDLTALTRRLAHSLSKAAPDNDLPAKALDYLKRKYLQSSPLRDAASAPKDAK